MDSVVSANGSTHVILVMNMRRFVVPEEQSRFETVRGTSALGEALRSTWPARLAASGLFVESRTASEEGGSVPRMSVEEVGYATGVFRTAMLAEHACPAFELRAPRDYPFPPGLRSNYQFRRLFLRVWQQWAVTIRPSPLGLFVIRLTRRFTTHAMPLEQLAADVVRLQSGFDIASARRWLERIATDPDLDEDERARRQSSVQNLLQWLGCGDGASGVDFVPVQWQLASEVASALVSAVGAEIPLESEPPLRLLAAPSAAAHQTHDSYVIYRLDRLQARPSVIPRLRDRKTPEAPGAGAAAAGPQRQHVQVLVTPSDVRESEPIRQRLANLLEGAVLRTPREGAEGGDHSDEERGARFFPRLRGERIEAILASDQATWHDEMCLLTSRVSVLLLSHRGHDKELFISGLPAAIKTSRIRYTWYWEALERQVEFVTEISVLARLVESASSGLLDELGRGIRAARSEMLRGNLQMDHRALALLVDRAANLSRLTALCQSLSNPHTWSRAEYAVGKARRLLEELAVPLALAHTAHNIGSVNSLVDHIDELYLAELSERNSTIAFWISAGIAATSMSLTLLNLPSFWADIEQLRNHTVDAAFLAWLPSLARLGSGLTVALMGGAAALLFLSVSRIRRAHRQLHARKRTSEEP